MLFFTGNEEVEKMLTALARDAVAAFVVSGVNISVDADMQVVVMVP